jgi:PAS domain S-box-containing protein
MSLIDQQACNSEYDSLTQSLLQGTFEHAALLTPQGKVTAANHSLASLLETKPEEMLGRPIYDFFSSPMLLFDQHCLERVLQTNSAYRLEDITFKGENYDIRFQPITNKDDQVVRIALFLSNITDRIKIEQERFSLATAMEQAAEPVIICDKSFRIQYVNQAFETLLGYALTEVKGLHLELVYKGWEQEEVLQQIIKCVENGEVWTGRTQNSTKEGKNLQFEKTVSPIRGKHGVILGYVSVWRDLSKTIELEKQFRQAQKMEAIGTLAGGIAHDFNNILGPIILNAELGQSLAENSREQKESFSQILEAAERAKSLVSQILNLSRKQEKEEPASFSLSSITKECLKLLRPSLPANIQISHQNLASSDHIVADATQIHQVVMNLCTNAAHAMANQGGHLTILLQNLNLNSRNQSQFPAAKPGYYVHLSVHDTGQGIAEENLDKIFDPFFTTKTKDLGTGLGLSVVHNIITRLGGALKVKSSPNQGSSFSVLIPESKSSEKEKQKAVQLAGHNKGQERIFLIDDETSIVESGQKALSRFGYQVKSCSSAMGALDIFMKDPEQFDLVLSDIGMPYLSGIDLARQFLEKRPDLPIILFSGYGDNLTFNQAKEIGVDYILQKPFYSEELIGAIQSTLSNRQT